MDTKFSVAVHILILISEAPKALTSDQMAQSAGTNASYIRKILALLKRAGIVEGHRGVGGYVLRDAAKNLSLLEIYRAVMAESDVHLLDIHQNVNDQSVVGRHIQPVLAGMFEEVETAFARSLAEKTLADCIDGIRERI